MVSSISCLIGDKLISGTCVTAMYNGSNQSFP
jgi:hypothetical protein